MVSLEPVDVREDRHLSRLADDLQPVSGVGALRVGHEGTHRHRVVAQQSLDAFSGEGCLRTKGEAVVHTLRRIRDSADERLSIRGAATEDNAVDRDAAWVIEV